MAMMDDKYFLISHIRNSFITSDDTGMCEMILENDEGMAGDRLSTGAEKRPTTWAGSCGEAAESLSDSAMESDTELSHSYDILPDMDFASHRRRSNTAQRLEKLKREKHKQSKIKHIPWKDVQHTVDELGEYFEKKAVEPRGEVPRRSLLSIQLEQFSTAPNNPFTEFAKFDGRSVGGIPTKKIDIFLTMAHAKDRPYPMTVIAISSAKIHDVIGLICWQYTTEERQPPVTTNIDAFALHISEDDGEVDMDFPALDRREPLSKFGFAKLALVEKRLPKTPVQEKAIVVTINTPSKEKVVLAVDSKSVLMKDILTQIMEKRVLRQRPGLEYRLEKQEEPGIAVDLESQLSAVGTLEFFLLRTNSVRGNSKEEPIPTSMCAMAESLSSHQYKSFIVNMFHKLRTNKEVQLGISGEKIEIDPVSGKGIIFKQKAVTYDTEHIASCTLTDDRASGKSSFRLVYHTPEHGFKHHDFEGDSHVVKEIVQKINNILEMRSSPVRKDYKAYKERKAQKKYSLV